MKFFFNVSSRSEIQIKNSSHRIYNNLCKKYTPTYNCFENGFQNPTDEPDIEKLELLYSSAIKALSSSDIVVLEVSTNSFTQGYILQKALEMSKPVIALYQKGKFSIFAKGIKNNLFQILEYDEFDLESQLNVALNDAIKNLELHFNCYLTQDINLYLKWMSKKKQLSKSAVVRELLRDHMQSNQEYA